MYRGRGHEIVGGVAALGEGVAAPALGARVGIPWLGWTCGQCRYCRAGKENLCESALFTGYTRDGGYAEFALADARFCFPVAESYGAAEAAPLLCAGLIGYRSLRMAGEGKLPGIYGFGAPAPIVAPRAPPEGGRRFAFLTPV